LGRFLSIEVAVVLLVMLWRCFMRTSANEKRLIRKLQLRGTLTEQLIRNSSEWLDAEQFDDSPALMRYFMDLRQAFILEGWQPSTSRPARLARRLFNRGTGPRDPRR
jgi:hypothetical protein